MLPDGHCKTEAEARGTPLHGGPPDSACSGCMLVLPAVLSALVRHSRKTRVAHLGLSKHGCPIMMATDLPFVPWLVLAAAPPPLAASNSSVNGQLSAASAKEHRWQRPKSRVRTCLDCSISFGQAASGWRVTKMSAKPDAFFPKSSLQLTSCCSLACSHKQVRAKGACANELRI